jgi:cysteine desulfurase
VTGLNGNRVYLDWNATAPLRPEARAAMLEAMDVVGNPSSVHAEGRAAKAIIERARGQVAALIGCEPSEVVFTSGATEAARTVLDQDGRFDKVLACDAVEHECVVENVALRAVSGAKLDQKGVVQLSEASMKIALGDIEPDHCIAAITAANGETGVKQDEALRVAWSMSEQNASLSIFCDAVQALGKTPFAGRFDQMDYAAISAHKLGGPKGTGALTVASGIDLPPLIDGGGQEQGRRSGTENVVGIAGFGAAAEAAQRDLENGAWERVEKLRNILEGALAEAAPETIFFGQESPRLPNTSCFAVPGWKGETQVMHMDLAGFAVSAGSACSSGKVNKASRVLLAMGFDEITASSAIRVSMGPTTTEAEVMAFADAWKTAYRRRKARAA